ncbi:hypothetical protein PHAVU_001G162500 [Phaseolus vulgaris]|uniref:CRIB domain-containing protein n=1 Tax=Phaseolus vulgaris TaxID=3885 RepID=V7CWJ2_PHAVU|nr:hypothetical protein PHAVU_001G162500g [Phaseolus vulgaris]ESW34557.1 hypothetical protein PHAVU_001G162500g [Phaseolus vulgaris]
MSNNNNKVKGLLKGLRFISQIFDNDKDSDIEIGQPTDVKHVAHIGWNGHDPSENNPSWMNEFKSVPGNASASPNHKEDIHSNESNSSLQRNSADLMERSSRSVKSQGCDDARHSIDLAKSKRQSHSMGTVRESQTKERSDRPRRTKRSAKYSQPNDSCNASKDTDQDMHTGDSLQQDSDLAPKKTRPKMLKDGSNVGGGSARTRSKAKSKDSQHEGHGRRSCSKLTHKQESIEEDGHFERESRESTLNSNLN